jgi:hypothetical protein
MVDSNTTHPCPGDVVQHNRTGVRVCVRACVLSLLGALSGPLRLLGGLGGPVVRPGLAVKKDNLLQVLTKDAN